MQKTQKVPQTKSAECLEDFPLSEHQNIRKAVLCVLPKEFCVRRSGKDPMIQGFYYSSKQKISEYKKEFMSPLSAAQRGIEDDIIMPSVTRKRIISALQLLKSKKAYKLQKKSREYPSIVKRQSIV